MALYSLLRRASSSVVPFTIRVVGSQRSFHAVRSLQTGILDRSFIPSAMRFSSAKQPADQNLLNILQSEIDCADETEGQNTVDEIPERFPFEVEDNLGERTVILTRKLGDETIKIEADIPNLAMEGEVEDDDDDESSNDSSIPLVVSVSKRSGLRLEFSITAFPSGEYSIDSLSIKKPESSEELLAYEGPEFNDLDENLQKAFCTYLEARGVDVNVATFLHGYMVAKEGKEYKNWLNNLKSFVEH